MKRGSRPSYVAVAVAKVLYYPTQGYNNRSTAQLVRMDKQRLLLFLLYALYTIKRPLTLLILLSVGVCVSLRQTPLGPTGKNNRFPFLDILGYLKNTHKNPKFGRVRQV